jgi:shikimate dehydrogenase/3-dehydroquinate dehydratase type I
MEHLMFTACVMHSNIEKFLSISQSVESKADVIEWRLDALSDEDLCHCETHRPKRPLIITDRSLAQGGYCHRLPSERLERLKKATKLCAPEYCDCETDIALAYWKWAEKHAPTTKILLSQHCQSVPLHLERILETLQSMPHHYLKIAAHAHNHLDALRLMALGKQNPILTTVAMGPAGTNARILSPWYNNVFHFFAAHPAHPTGPGQIAMTDAQRHISDATAVYALLGNPITQSLGPTWHNHHFTQQKINAHYVGWEINEHQWPMAKKFLRCLAFSGYSITTPLKHRCVQDVEHPSTLTQQAQACNTIRCIDNLWYGHNTDGPAAAELISQLQVKPSSCHILGNGPTARSIAHCCQKKSWPTVVYARTKKNLCNTLHTHDINNIKQFPDGAIIINTIPGHTTDFPLHLANAMNHTHLLMDCAYQPTPSPLTQHALSLGCQIIDGRELFVAQALRQQYLWRVCSQHITSQPMSTLKSEPPCNKKTETL